jgi:transcriptional regulator with XRE-family HTH domain
VSKSKPIDFRDIIRRRIEELGISQAEAARRGGMHPTRLNDYLAGRRDITASTLAAIITGLGLRFAISE